MIAGKACAAIHYAARLMSCKDIKNPFMGQSFKVKICLYRIIFAILHLLCSFQFS